MTMLRQKWLIRAPFGIISALSRHASRITHSDGESKRTLQFQIALPLYCSRPSDTLAPSSGKKFISPQLQGRPLARSLDGPFICRATHIFHLLWYLRRWQLISLASIQPERGFTFPNFIRGVIFSSIHIALWTEFQQSWLLLF
jgi:hypothetical protein